MLYVLIFLQALSDLCTNLMLSLSFF
uniref:Uncharacterized protein n=1 Tax=Anguilla anguilla TaxID=7936 RepID=A0A0E9S4H6_ANGAN